MDKINFLSYDGRDILQRLSYMIRYNNAIHIHNENVAEHSFYVALFSLEICNYLGIDHRDAVKLALIHDVSESITSDIPHDVKCTMFNLEKLCEQFEEGFNKVQFGIDTESKKYKADKAIVDLADVLSVMQYSQKEIEFGNVIKFGPIYENVLHRIDKCADELKKYFNPHSVDKLISVIKGE